jgi:hypothetical protein
MLLEIATHDLLCSEACSKQHEICVGGHTLRSEDGKSEVRDAGAARSRQT